MKQKFLKCEKCGTIIDIIKDCTCENCGINCCGEPMKELIAGESDGAQEKHVPIYVREENKIIVNIGEISHPMAEEHHIEWVSIQTKFGSQRKVLTPGDEPKTYFYICENDEVEAVYAYCNLHGLWKA